MVAHILVSELSFGVLSHLIQVGYLRRQSTGEAAVPGAGWALGGYFGKLRAVWRGGGTVVLEPKSLVLHSGLWRGRARRQ